MMAKRIGPPEEQGQRPGGKRWELWGTPLVLIDENNGREFLKRWRVLQTPIGSIFIHRMQVPDPGIDLHDHPWAFFSLILKGGYSEVVSQTQRPATEQRVRRRKRWSWSIFRLDQCHTIVKLERSPTWTLVITGPTRRRWGFYVDGQWFDWEHEYDYSRRYPWKADAIAVDLLAEEILGPEGQEVEKIGLRAYFDSPCACMCHFLSDGLGMSHAVTCCPQVGRRRAWAET